MRSPPSADSKRNAPPSGRSFANAETGVSRSARRSRMTGTSSMVAGAVITTFTLPSVAFGALPLPPKTNSPRPISGRGLVVPPDRAVASLRRPQPLLSASEAPGLARAFRTPTHSAPVGNGGLPAAASRFLSPRRLARAIRSRSPSRFSPSPVRFPGRATYSFPLERRSGHRSETPGFWPSLRPGSVAQGVAVQLISEELTSVWSAPRPHGGAVHPAHPPPTEGT